MEKSERISDVEIKKAETLNNIIRWTIVSLVAIGTISVVLIWFFS